MPPDGPRWEDQADSGQGQACGHILRCDKGHHRRDEDGGGTDEEIAGQAERGHRQSRAVASGAAVSAGRFNFVMWKGLRRSRWLIGSVEIGGRGYRRGR